MTIDRHDKEILKEALKEWMDARFAAFGKFSFGAFLAACLGIITWALLTLSGWEKVIK